MNRNRKMKRKITASLAASLAVVVGAVPVLAAESSIKQLNTDNVYKEETVYVNADASGNQTSVIVSNWLKNAGSEKELEDSSILKDIQNVKGDETYQASGNSLTWKTEGKDIYYQGSTDKKLPVSVHFTYYLDGKEMNPSDLSGKSGRLRIKVAYENNTRQTVEIDGKKESIYTPFALLTGMILPDEIFSNVTIDNGKVISDGQRSIVLGIAMPGLADSLGLNKTDSSADLLSLDIPETLEISADVENFSMDPTFTIALSDILDFLDTNGISDMSELTEALDDLEEATLQLVDGSEELFNGTDTLNSNYQELDSGIQTLKAGIDTAASGSNTLAEGITTYINGAAQLSDGAVSYVNGEQQIADGARQLEPLIAGLNNIHEGTALLYSAMDGQGSADEDLRVASGQLAAGTQLLKDNLDKMSGILDSLDSVEQLGGQLISEAQALSSTLQNQVATPLQSAAGAASQLKEQLKTLESGLSSAAAAAAQSAAEQLNIQIEAKNTEMQTKAGQVQAEANQKLSGARNAIQSQLDALDQSANPEAAQALQTALQQLDGDVTVSQPEALQPISASDLNITIPDEALAPLMQTLTILETSAQQFASFLANPEFSSQLETMQKQLEALSSFQVPTGSVSLLKQSVNALNDGMQQLDSAIGSLSGKVKGMNEQTASLPEAGAGIQTLLYGFDTLGQHNGDLISGAAELTQSNPLLFQGVQTLQTGTAQLSDGALTLQNGSSQVKGGIEQIKDGARELKDGMQEFNEEGIEKMTSALKDEFGELMDRIEALNSNTCAYDTFSGKTDAMDGNVKFIIETEAIK
ncbi:hypothetical protein DXA96_15800 [Lachnospiraceae bacterium OF09-33XD]|nr:hypothetical protein DXA96_15800 [Lachnospiraceae bacterium OF09-33XD]